MPIVYESASKGSGGTVTSVTAADTSIVIAGTAAAPTVATGTLDVIAADHPAAADWSNNSHKITGLANGTAATDAAAFGQITGADGWVDDTAETWTFASASTFTVAGDLRTKYQVGTRLKLTQSATVKYFVVILDPTFGGGNTTVTISGGIDYTFANAAVSSNFHSYAASPQGYPGWFNWTPGYTGFSANPTLREAKFAVVGRAANVAYADNGNGTSNATGFTITGCPVAPNAGVSFTSFQCTVVDSGTTQNSPGNCFWSGGSSTITIQKTLGGTGFTASGAKGCTGGGLQAMVLTL